MSEAITLWLAQYGHTTITVNRAEYEKAKADEEIDDGSGLDDTCMECSSGACWYCDEGVVGEDRG